MKNEGSRLNLIIFFAIFVNLFLYREFGSVAFAIIMAMLGILVIGLFGKWNRIGKLSAETGVVALALLGGLTVITMTSPVQILLVVATYLFGYLIACYTLMRGYIPQGSVETALGPVQTVGAYLTSGLSLVTGGKEWQNLWQKPKLVTAKSPLRPYLTGFAVGLPIIIILTSWLSTADPIFASFVNSLVNKELLATLPWRLITTIVIASLLVPALAMRLNNKYRSPFGFLSRVKWKRETMVVLTMVSLVMGAFLVMQWPYVFARVAETSLAQYGVKTYSEYVKAGFGELIQVAILVVVISGLSHLVYRNNDDKHLDKWLLLAQGILGLEFVIFVISIFRRVWLYTSYHGLSMARIYGLIFLSYIVGITISLALRYITQRKMYRFEVLWTLGVIIFAIFFNTERLILKNPPTVNGQVDYVYLSRMSARGYEGWVEAYSWAKQVINKEAVTSDMIGASRRRDVLYAQWILQHINEYSKYYTLRYGTEQEGDLHMSKLDRFYTWNAREKATYERMKRDITNSEIQSLLNMASMIQYRIDRQPEGERSVDVDRSLNSPFL